MPSLTVGVNNVRNRPMQQQLGQLKQIPPDYQRLPDYQRPSLARLTWFVLVAMIIGVGFIVWQRISDPTQLLSPAPFGALFGWAITIPIHERIHWAAYKWLGYDELTIDSGWNRPFLSPQGYVSHNGIKSRKHLLYIFPAPFVVLNSIALLLLFTLREPTILMCLSGVLVLNTAGSLHDLYRTKWLFNLPRGTLIDRKGHPYAPPG